MTSLPKIALTMGDPGGIGPELILKTLAHWQGDPFIPIIFGPKDVIAHPALRFLAGQLSDPNTGFYPNTHPDSQFSFAAPSAVNGHHMVEALCNAIDFAKRGDVDAIVTAPANKESIQMAGYPYSGHTTLLADKSGVADISMGFYSPKLKVVLATVHIPLMSVAETLTRDVLEKAFQNTLGFAKLMGIEAPKIALAGLNPHAGENGLFGNEDQETLAPFVAEKQANGHPTFTGPYPPDTLFQRAATGEFDFVIALYHDQGLIPVKCLGFGEAVNITLGLPFIRTSPDHGTAYDIAFQGQADTQSFDASLRLALALVKQQKQLSHAT